MINIKIYKYSVRPLTTLKTKYIISHICLVRCNSFSITKMDYWPIIIRRIIFQVWYYIIGYQIRINFFLTQFIVRKFEITYYFLRVFLTLLKSNIRCWSITLWSNFSLIEKHEIRYIHFWWSCRVVLIIILIQKET